METLIVTGGIYTLAFAVCFVMFRFVRPYFLRVFEAY